ncbi:MULTISPECIES: DUF389 domain-containing protein [Tenacibaculum]|uniref:DUF389 domain-containing protein n=1 Tax=Tenacibaculum TaxID=104267 RepID=UPI001F0AF068|nr:MULTISPECIES: DUF389 domain-containing protein [Tenacibaculum]MCH3880793.1 DUF389 domain-containing protein [Tenacibaculum aquimarinum]MCH3884330.1 DUF389 domain-containing protein [Tenacibaculum aquimarinum]MDO6599608.1 DUF389 domain-containing protein [Tenacibaculum sp. 1_MG-2023]
MEENNKELEIEQSKQEVREDAIGLVESIKKFIKDIFDFRHDTDHDATILAIKNDIPLKGATAWILIFAIFVASIGLNVSSTAVVIGAMLISPLMGPILGIGMSLAINDIDTLKSSFINLLVMVVLSVLTAYLYFWISPLTELTPELEARTSPNILDVLIAIFGGLALIVARTKKGTIASVIFGVAIATALMPPLCTAGYGLAIGNYSFFFGAMYLFTINTTFIALSTFIVLKVLSFPMLKYANSQKRKRIAQMAAFFGLIAMIPAVLTFLTLLSETRMNQEVKSFIQNEIKGNVSLQLIEFEPNLETKTIDLNFFNEITDATKNDLENELVSDTKYNHIKDFTLNIKGSDTKSFDMITTAYKEKRQELQESKNIIAGLQKQIEDLQGTVSSLNQRIELNAQNKNQKVVAFSSIAKDAKIRYNGIQEIGFANVLLSKDFIKIDTIPVLTLKWNRSLPDSIISPKERELRTWLQKEMELDTLFIKRD